MNTRVTLYVMVAVVLGYSLISVLPSQVSIYVDKGKMLSSQSGENPPVPGENNKLSSSDNASVLGSGDTSNNTILNSSRTQVAENASTTSSTTPSSPTNFQERELPNYMSIGRWWVLDLVLALSVYLIAKRLF
jgi:hypothetical protein